MTDSPRAAQRALLDRLDGVERERSVLYAREARVAAAMAQLWGDDEGVVLEMAGTARMGQARSSGRLVRGERLVTLFPTALRLLELGAMRVATVEIVLEVSKYGSAEVQRHLDGRLAERVCEMDAVDVRRLVAATLLEVEAELDAEAQRERLERAHANRGVWIKPVEDGMARIGAEIDQLGARRWALDFQELVRAQKVLDDRDGIVRSQAQRQADVFAELPSRVLDLVDVARRGRLDAVMDRVVAGRDVDGHVPPPRVSPAEQEELDLGVPASSSPAWWRRDREDVVQDLMRLPVRRPSTLVVHVPMTTLLELDQRTGWLEGFGPVPALHARMLQPVSALRRVGVDERTGVPLGMDPVVGPAAPWAVELDLDPPEHPDVEGERARLLRLLGPMYVTDAAEPQHDPSVALRELVRVRDQGCDGPGCPRTASACELDHETEFAEGGQTSAWNLRHRSTRCHHAKHAGWTVEHDHGSGASTWTSPADSRYERVGPWRPPSELPDDVRLCAPRIEPPLGDAPDPAAVAGERELPLWPDPPRPRRSRYVDPDHIREDGTVAPAPEPGRPSPRAIAHPDDDPPPF